MHDGNQQHTVFQQLFFHQAIFLHDCLHAGMAAFGNCPDRLPFAGVAKLQGTAAWEGFVGFRPDGCQQFTGDAVPDAAFQPQFRLQGDGGRCGEGVGTIFHDGMEGDFIPVSDVMQGDMVFKRFFSFEESRHAAFLPHQHLTAQHAADLDGGVFGVEDAVQAADITPAVIDLVGDEVLTGDLGAGGEVGGEGVGWCFDTEGGGGAGGGVFGGKGVADGGFLRQAMGGTGEEEFSFTAEDTHLPCRIGNGFEFAGGGTHLDFAEVLFFDAIEFDQLAIREGEQHLFEGGIAILFAGIEEADTEAALDEEFAGDEAVGGIGGEGFTADDMEDGGARGTEFEFFGEEEGFFGMEAMGDEVEGAGFLLDMGGMDLADDLFFLEGMGFDTDADSTADIKAAWGDGTAGDVIGGGDEFSGDMFKGGREVEVTAEVEGLGDALEDMAFGTAIEDADLCLQFVGKAVTGWGEGLGEEGGGDSTFDKFADIGVVVGENIIQLHALFLHGAANGFRDGNHSMIDVQFHRKPPCVGLCYEFMQGVSRIERKGRMPL